MYLPALSMSKIVNSAKSLAGMFTIHFLDGLLRAQRFQERNNRHHVTSERNANRLENSRRMFSSIMGLKGRCE